MVTTKISSQLVLPATETPQEVMYLSDCDQIKPLTHAPTVYFYRASTTGYKKTLPELIEIAKDSLSKTLIKFYPLAGRLYWTNNNSGRVELHCNSKGALLVEAESDLTIDDFGDFSPTPEIRSLIPSVDFSATPIEEVPLLLVQITKLKCGGVTLGTGTSHVVVDGQSAAHFVMEWAKVARGEESDDHPFLDRTILLKQREYDVDKNLPDLKYNDFFNLPLLLGQGDNLEERKKETVALMLKLSKVQIETLKNKSNEDLLSDEQIESLMKITASLSINEENIGQELHGLDNKQLAMLKNMANSQLNAKIEALKGESSQELQTLMKIKQLEMIKNMANEMADQLALNFAAAQALAPENPIQYQGNRASKLKEKIQQLYPFSRFEAVCAHIWKCLTMARGLDPEQETVLFVTIDFRNRINPPLPNRYFGNAVMPLPVSSTTGELLAKPLSFAARKIRTAIESVSDEYVRCYLNCIDNIPNISSKRHFHTVGCAQGSFYGNPNLIVTSWVGLPIYGANLWGDEVCFLGPGSLGYDGRVFMIPSPDEDGAFLVPMRVQAEHADAFEKYFYEQI